MIKTNLIWLIVLVFIIVAFAGFIAFGYLSTKDDQEKYSFTRNFPFEINKSPVSRTFSYLCGGFAFLPLTFILPLYSDFGTLGFYSVFIVCVFGFTALAASALVNLPTTYLKPHIVLSTIVMALAFLCAALTTIYSVLVCNISMRSGHSGGLQIAFAAIAGLLAIGMPVLILNPKLAKWAKLEEVIVDNQKAYTRGKFFPLAYSEWAALLVIFLSELLFLGSMISL